MNLIALTLVRDAAWCLRATGAATLTWADALVVLLHRCTDASPALAAELARAHRGRVRVITRDDPGWPQWEHRQAALEVARNLGATHVSVVDDDELLAAPAVPLIRDAAARVPPGHTLKIPWWRLTSAARVGTVGQVDLVVGLAPTVRWEPLAFPEGLRSPLGLIAGRVWEGTPGPLLHLGDVPPGRLLARYALYRLCARLAWPAATPKEIAHRWQLPAQDDGQPVPADFWPAGALAQVDLNAPSWHAGECRRLVAAHGRDRFAGLDLLGVV
jgi:hypothetical protein